MEWTFWEMSNSLPSPTPLEDRGCHGRPSPGLDKWATGELSGSQLWLPFQSQEEIFKQGCSNPTSKDSHLIDLGISIVKKSPASTLTRKETQGFSAFLSILTTVAANSCRSVKTYQQDFFFCQAACGILVP